MFTYFSWSHYFLFVGFLLFAYFILLGFLYYRKDIHRLLFPRRNAMNEMIEAPIKTAPQLLHMVHELVSELGGVIRSASENSTVLPELMVAIKNKIKDFSG